MICGYEVAARISDYWNVQVSHCLDDIFAEAIFVREVIAGVVDTAVDTASHVPVMWSASV